MKLKFYSLLFLVLFYVPAAYAEPEVSVQTNFYQVQGNTLEELSESMKMSAPPRMGENFGSTKWNVAWTYEVSPGPAGCSVTSSHVKLDVIFYLPDWRRSPGEDKKTREKWDQFAEKLKRHEDGHEKIGLEAARKIENLVKSIGTFENCGELDRVLNQAAQTVVAEKRAEEVRYDARTRHGLRQGARLKYSKAKSLNPAPVSPAKGDSKKVPVSNAERVE